MIKFLNHDNASRITMDVVKGELLVNKVKTTPDLTKDRVFSWFYNLLSQMIQYHKCKHNRIYRYLNPFSVVITEEEEVYLLDIDASSNHFVLKNLQTPSMREHFLKTTIQPTEENKIRYDIYCFGKTLQYVLASSESLISLSKREELRLFNLVEKCFEENIKKSYSSFAQIKKDLNFTKVKRGKDTPGLKSKKLKLILGIAVALIVVNIALGMILKATPEGNGEKAGEDLNEPVATENVGETDEIEEELLEESSDGEYHREGQGDESSEERNDEVRGESGQEEQQRTSDGEADGDHGRGEEGSLDEFLQSLDEDLNRLLGYLHQNDKESNQKIISHGEEMELIILRGLAMAYDREGYHELAIAAYGRLMGIEIREEHLERVILRKMKLEEEIGWLEQALETGRNGLELLEGNLEIGRTYLEILIDGERASPQEVMREYERLKALIPELEEDQIGERIERLE